MEKEPRRKKRIGVYFRTPPDLLDMMKRSAAENGETMTDVFIRSVCRELGAEFVGTPPRLQKLSDGG